MRYIYVYISPTPLFYSKELKHSHELQHSSPAFAAHSPLSESRVLRHSASVGWGGGGAVGGWGCVIKRLHSGTHSQIYPSQLGSLGRQQGCHWSEPVGRRNDF